MDSYIGWVGGKKQLRGEILRHFPETGIGRYIEVFGGAGWVFFGKPKASKQLEVFNDADGELINIYRCLKHHATALADELDLLPQSRELFFDYAAQEPLRGFTDIQRAARSLYLIKMSFGSNRDTFATAKRGLENMCSSFSALQSRLKGVIIEHLDFERLIRIYDRPDALFYCDPPYFGAESYYRASFTQEDHQRLADCLHRIKGKFLLSYNDHPAIRKLYADDLITPLVRRNTLPVCGTDYHEILVQNFA